MVEYRGFTVEPKRDFVGAGFFVDGRFVRRGYVVVKDGCNAMPGAAWFYTIESAKQAVDVLIDVGGADIWKRSVGYARRFWARMDAQKASAS